MAPPRSTSFDELDDARGGAVMDTVDDELRDMVAMMPGRNPDRMFSDATSRAPPASAPSSLARDRHGAGAGDADSASYYYYYSSTGGNTTRANLDAPPLPPTPRANSPVQQPPAARPRTHGATPPPPKKQQHAVVPAPRAAPPAPPRTLAASVSLARDNIADALAVAAGRFWADDLARIGAILRRRGERLAPPLRRVLAHAADVLSGIVHLRRALSAATALLTHDPRIRDLAKHTAWGAAAAIRIALALAAAMAAAARQAHTTITKQAVPAARVALPRTYATVVFAALRAARNSPWALVLGPASITLALTAARIPDPLWLHRKFRVSATPSVRMALSNGGYLPASSGARAAVTDGEGYDERGMVRGGQADDDSDANRSSLSYTYTYGTGTTRLTDKMDDVEEDGGRIGDGAAARGRDVDPTTGEYYYTYGTGTTFAGNDTTIAGSVGAPVPFAAANGKGTAGNDRLSGKALDRARGGHGKENDRRRSFRSDFGDGDSEAFDY